MYVRDPFCQKGNLNLNRGSSYTNGVAPAELKISASLFTDPLPDLSLRPVRSCLTYTALRSTSLLAGLEWSLVSSSAVAGGSRVRNHAAEIRQVNESQQ